MTIKSLIKNIIIYKAHKDYILNQRMVYAVFIAIVDLKQV